MVSFKDSINRIIKHNKNLNRTYIKGLYKLSNMLDSEFQEQFYLKNTSK